MDYEMKKQDDNCIITDLCNVESIKIGFSFGAAEYYRKNANFCPFGHICLCLKSDGKLFSEEYIAFYNQTSTPDGAITYSDGEDEGNDPYEEVFSIDLNRLPAEINELMFVVKDFLPEFSNHVVKFSSEAIQKQYDLPNKNKTKEPNTDRVLIRLCRNSGWVVKVCEEFCDIGSLMENSG